MSDTLHKLLEAIEEADRASVHNQCHIGLDGWFEIVRLCKKMRQEMARDSDDPACAVCGGIGSIPNAVEGPFGMCQERISCPACK